MKKHSTLFVSLLLFNVTLPSSVTCAWRWQHTSGPYGGIVLDIASKGSGEIYVVEWSGVFRSSDNGSTWTQLTPDLQTNFQRFHTVGIDSAGGVFLGTRLDTIYRSTDKGNTWIPKPNGLPAYFAASGFCTAPWGTVYVRGDSGNQSIMFWTTNLGDTWERIGISGLPARSNFTSFTIGTGSSESILATVQNMDDALSRLYRSTDRGETWFALSPTGVSPADTMLFVTAARSPGLFFMSTYYVNETVWAYRNFISNDDGANWTEILSSSGLPINTQLLPSIDPHTGNYYAIGVRNNTLTGAVYGTAIYDAIYRSTDVGATWNVVATTGREGAANSSIWIDQDGAIFSPCVLGGMYRSTDNGTSWQLSVQGLKSALCVRLCVDSTGRIFVGTQESGSYRSSDRGATWERMLTGMSGSGSFQFVAFPDGVIVAGDTTSGILRSTNHGDSWSSANTGLDESKVGSLSIAPNNNLFVGTTAGVSMSTDEGLTWNTRSNGLPSSGIYAISATVPGTLLAGAPTGIFRSTDEGVSWVASNSGLLDPHIYSLWVTGQGTVLAGTGKSVYRSTDGGVNWSSSKSGLAPTGIVYGMANGPDGSVYAGLVLNVDDIPPTGLCRSTDDGKHWMRYDTGYTIRPSISPGVAVGRDGTIYAATAFEGVMRLDNVSAVAPPSALPSAFAMAAPFPNPAGSYCTIMYDVEDASPVALTVVDALGRTILHFNSERPSSGAQTITIPTGALHPGVYHCVLRSATKQWVQPMIVAK